MKLFFWKKWAKAAVENDYDFKSMDAEATVKNKGLMKEFEGIKTPLSKEELEELMVSQNEFYDYFCSRNPGDEGFYCDEKWRTSAHIDVPDEELDPIEVWGKNNRLVVRLSGTLKLKALCIEERLLLLGDSRKSAAKIRSNIYAEVDAIAFSRKMSLPEKVVALYEYDKKLGDKWRYEDVKEKAQKKAEDKLEKKE